MDPRQPHHDDAEKKAGIATALGPEQSLWETDDSFLGRAERFATDSLFQWLGARVLEWRATRAPDTSEHQAESDPASNAFANAHLAWIFGRSLTPAALTLCRYLRNRGFSARDLRLAIFCRYIRKDGTVRINWWKERILLACGVFLLAVTLAGCVQLGLQLADTSAGILPAISVAATACLLLLSIQYPLLLLTLRAPLVALRLERIWRTRT